MRCFAVCTAVQDRTRLRELNSALRDWHRADQGTNSLDEDLTAFACLQQTPASTCQFIDNHTTAAVHLDYGRSAFLQILGQESSLLWCEICDVQFLYPS